MAGRKPIEKRLMNIEDKISDVMNKLCEMSPCEPKTDDEVQDE